MKLLVNIFWLVLLSAAFLFFPQVAKAATLNSIAYGPSGSTVGTYVAASDSDFVVFTPVTAISPGSTITLTFPAGTTLNASNTSVIDFTISQETSGLCVVSGSDTVPTSVSVNQSNRTITLTVAGDALSETVGLLNCGEGEVTIKTTGLLAGSEIRHPTTTTSTGVFQVATSVGDSGSISNVSFPPDSESYLAVTGTASMTAGNSNELTITAYDQYANVATGYTGSKSLTFSGLSNAPDGTVPSIEATNQGSATSISFSSGVSAANAATLVAYKAETAALDVSDGSINSAGDASYDLDLVVSAAAATTVAKNSGDAQTATVNQTLDNAFQVIVTDTYQNPISGASITFSISSTPSGASGQSTTPDSASTNESGLIDTSLTLGNVAGTYQVLATVSGVGSVTFSATASDNTPPTISDIVITPSSDSVTVTWTTNEDASTQLNYGLTTSYGSSTTESDTSTRVTSHSDTISGLLSCTRYHVRLLSTDYSTNQATSSDQVFRTSGCLGGSSTLSDTVASITTAAGGTSSLLSSGKGITLSIPSAFSDSDAAFQIKQLSKTEVLAAAPVVGVSSVGNYVYELDAYSAIATKVTSFNQPISITIAYDDSEVSNIDTDTLRIFRWTGSAWSELSNCTVNTTAKTVTCTTTAFSVFILAGQAVEESESSGNSGSSGSSSSSSSSSSPASPKNCSEAVPGSAPWLYAAEAINSSQVKIYFSEASDPVSHYVLQYGLEASNYSYAVQNIGGKGTRTFTIEKLQPNTKYYFRVRAGNNCATGSWSNEVSVQTNKRSISLLSSKTVNIERIENNSSSMSSEVEEEAAQEKSEPIAKKYTLKIKLVDDQGNPLKNTKVTIHSEPKTGKTNKEGEVVFENVEYGNHQLIIDSFIYDGQQSIFVDGEEQTINLNVTVKPKLTFFTFLVFINVTFLMIIGLLAYLAKRKPKRGASSSLRFQHRVF